MSDLLSELHDNLFVITFNRIDKHNAFDDTLLNSLQAILDDAIANPHVRVIILKAHGKHFSAGADLAWMQRMADYSEQENVADAMILARVMNTLYQCPKPTIAVVQGATFGGGIGLIAACDIAIATNNAQFCFSEVKLGLIPAVISPYVIKAIGERAAKWLFMTGELFNAEQAKKLQLIQFCVNDDELWSFALDYARKITQLPANAVMDCKALVSKISHQPINDNLLQETAALIAKKRVSEEGQKGLTAFLGKQKLSGS